MLIVAECNMKLILTRHGRTIANEAGILEGRLPGELSMFGIKQAEKLALRLKNEKLDCIYSSDAKRAVDTAMAVAKYHKKTPFKLALELRENFLGSFEGKPNESIDWSNPPPDVESKTSLDLRAKKMIDKAYSECPSGTVLFVGHNAINKALIRVITDDPAFSAKQQNASVSIFEIKEDKSHVIHCLNCVEHLE
ncbi:MAG: histidine phosphatase family protein [Candidatus Woesearchaeota archaeon]